MFKQENPPDIRGAVDAIQPFLRFARGEHAFRPVDVDVPEEYKQAVRVYGSFCQQAYETPEIAKLITAHYRVEHARVDITHMSMSTSHENIYLGANPRKKWKPQLLLAVRQFTDQHQTLDGFKAKILEEYGNEPGNKWEFEELDELSYDKSMSDHYFAAFRNFSVEDLWKNYRLFYQFVDRTRWIFQNMRQQIINAQLRVPNKGDVESVMRSMVQANTILQSAFKRK